MGDGNSAVQHPVFVGEEGDAAPAQGEHLVESEPEIKQLVREETSKQLNIAIQQFSGPMPSAAQFEGYERVLPGTALAIREEFQANGKHIREMERRAMEATIYDKRQNRWVAFVLVLACLGATLWLASIGATTIAGIVAGSTILAVLAAFMKGPSAKSSSPPESDE